MARRRKASLESQQRPGDADSNLETDSWLLRQKLSLWRRANTNATSYQGLGPVDAAIRKASRKYEADDTFFNTYAHVSHGFKNYLDSVFGTNALSDGADLRVPSDARSLAAQLEDVYTAVTESTDPLSVLYALLDINRVHEAYQW